MSLDYWYAGGLRNRIHHIKGSPKIVYFNVLARMIRVNGRISIRKKVWVDEFLNLDLEWGRR